MTYPRNVQSSSTDNYDDRPNELLVSSALVGTTAMNVINTTIELQPPSALIKATTMDMNDSTTSPPHSSALVNTKTMQINNNTIALPASSAVVEAADVETNESAASSASPLPAIANNTMDGNDSTTNLPQSADLATTMNDTTAPSPSPVLSLITILPLEMRIPIYIPNLSMTIAGQPPALLHALKGTVDYTTAQDEYKRINFVLCDATFGAFRRMSRQGKFKNILFLNIRCDSFTISPHVGRHPIHSHVTKLMNNFLTINVTANPPRNPAIAANEERSFDACRNVHNILWVLGQMMVASQQPPSERRIRVKFLDYQGECWNAASIRNQVGDVENALAGGASATRGWRTARREFVGDGGVVHDGIVWVWDAL